MTETKSESPFDSPLQNILHAAWWIKRCNQFLEEDAKERNLPTNHDDVQEVSNEG